MSLKLLALALLLLLQARPAASPPPPPGLSWSEAESLGRKLESIEKRKRAGGPARPETVVVTEGELNSYLNLNMRERMPRGVSDVTVRLEHERIQAKGLVDLEQVRDKIPSAGPWSPWVLLAGSVPVSIRGRLQTRDGFGTLEVEDVRMGSLPVPVTVLEQLVSSSTRSIENPEGFDIRAPFRLPYAVKRVRLEPGQGYLDF